MTKMRAPSRSQTSLATLTPNVAASQVIPALLSVTPATEGTARYRDMQQALDLRRTLIDAAGLYGTYVDDERVGRLAYGHRDRNRVCHEIGILTPGRPE
jgi:aryl-alcohol dehydrogenase-like predicted oxidoreductase